MSLKSKSDALKGKCTMLIAGEYYELGYEFSASYYRNTDSNGKPSGVTKMAQPFSLVILEPRSDGGKGDDNLLKLAIAKDPKGFKAEIEIPGPVEHSTTVKFTFEDCYIVSYSAAENQASMTMVAGKVTGKDFKEVQTWSNVK
mgnify:CR=1 FL=1